MERAAKQGDKDERGRVMTEKDIIQAYEKFPWTNGTRYEIIALCLQQVRRHNEELEEIVRRKYVENSNLNDIILSIREAKP
jgi:hypothetical protein